MRPISTPLIRHCHTIVTFCLLFAVLLGSVSLAHAAVTPAPDNSSGDLGALAGSVLVHDYAQPDPGNGGGFPVIDSLWLILMVAIVAFLVGWLYFKHKNSE